MRNRHNRRTRSTQIRRDLRPLWGLEQLECRRLLDADLLITSFSFNNGSWQVGYNVSEDLTTPFQISVVRSSDGATVGSANVTAANDRTAGPHVATFARTAGDVEHDYVLTAVLDSTGAVMETVEDNNSTPFSGAFLADGFVHVHGTSAGETIVLSQSGSSLDVTLAGASVGSFALANINEIRVHAQAGDDLLSTSLVSKVVRAFGGDGADTLNGGSADDFLYGDEAPAGPSVVGRFVFYNNSGWDSTSDDAAIAPDKTALLPGDAASYLNLTSYSRGLNGVMVDVKSPAHTPVAGDFTFRAGTTGDPNLWPTVATPTVDVRAGQGVGGSTRVTFTWPDNTIVDKWLQVAVNTTLGLPAADVFYFGNLVAEGGLGNSATTAEVNNYDTDFSVVTGMVPIDDPYDHNRDKFRDSADQEIIVQNYFNVVPLITAPASPSHDTLIGGDGKDVLRGGAGDDSLQGDAGNDTLVGGSGDDLLMGGLNFDTFEFSGSVALGADEIQEQAAVAPLFGNAIRFTGLDIDARHGGVVFDLGLAGPQAVSRVENPVNLQSATLLSITLNVPSSSHRIYGTSFADRLIGTDGVDEFHGDAGADILEGLGGGDLFQEIGSGDSVLAGAGADSIFVDAISSVASPVFVDAGGDEGDNVIAHDTQRTADGIYEFDSGRLKLNSNLIFSVFNSASVQILTGTGNDTIRVRSTLPGTAVTFHGNSGNDTFIAGDDATGAGLGLDAIQGTIRFEDLENTGIVRIDDAPSTVAHSYAVNGLHVSRTGAAMISLGFQIEALELTTGSANDVVDILATAASVTTTVNLGGGDDAVHIGQGSSLASITGPLTVNGGNGDDVFRLRGGSGTNLGVTLNGDAGSDTFQIEGAGAVALANLQIAAGSVATTDVDTLDLSDRAMTAWGGFQSVTGVEALDLSHNSLASFTFPSQFTKTGLQTLDLRYNDLDLAAAGTLGALTADLTALRQLLLYGNLPTGAIPTTDAAPDLVGVKGKLLRVDLPPVGLDFSQAA